MRKFSVFVVLAVILAAIAPLRADAQTSNLYDRATPEWGTPYNTIVSYPGGDSDYTTITSDDLCGRPDDLMGYAFHIYDSSYQGLGVYIYSSADEQTDWIFNGGPQTGFRAVYVDAGWDYYYSYTVSDNPLGVSPNPFYNNTINFADGQEEKYANSVSISTASWGGGPRNVNITVAGLCSGTGTPPTPTVAPECDETALSCKARHYWPMNEVSNGATRVDTIGLANLSSPGVGYSKHSKFGAAAAELDASRTMAESLNAETLSISPDGWSIAGWFRPTGAAGTHVITSKGMEYSINITATNYITFVAGGTTLTSLEPVVFDAWHLVTVVFDGSEYKLQVDTQTAVTGSGSASARGVDNLIFGWDYSGRLDEWIIWERAITDTQRGQLWNNSSGCFYPFLACNYLASENKLLDGGMEEYPESSGWYTDNGVDFGRRINRVPNFLQWILTGPAQCGDGYHYTLNDSGQYAPIAQDFTWAGGDFYWKIQTRGLRGLLGIAVSPDLQPLVHAYLENEEGVITDLINDTRQYPQSGDWRFNGGVVPGLDAGNYKLVLAGVDDVYTPYFDDVDIDTAPISESCSVDDEPTPTPTITATLRQTATQSTNPTQDAWTVTPGPSPTPSSLIVSNCGFENGATGWVLSAQSYISSVGGPIGPLYMVAQGSPGAYQTIWTATDQTLYITSYVLGYSSIRLVNTNTNAVVEVYAAYTSTWQQIRRSVPVTAGYWRLELGRTSSYSASGFDGVDVSINGYATSGFCVNTPTPGPTAYVQPTNTLTRTPTNAPTQTPIYITATPGPTKTPYGTPGGPEGPYTTTPNSSQMTSTAGWITTATHDAGTTGTYTPAPAPSGTPSSGWNGGDLPPGDGGVDGGGDPTPTMPPIWNPGDPPPASDAAGYWENVPCTENCDVSQTSWMPGFGSFGLPDTIDLPTDWFGAGDSGSYEFHECIKPVNSWSIAWWLDYERCLIFSFFSWGPKQHGIVTGIPQTFTKLEPFGTIAEVGDGMVVMRTQVAGIQSEIGYEGVNDPINPGEILSGSNGNDPWGENAQLHLFDNTGGITTGAYTGYCTHRLSDALSGNLANGACFALNVMKNVGVFPWVQFLINIASILSIAVSAFKIIGVAGSAAVIYAPTGDDEEVEQ